MASLLATCHPLALVERDGQSTWPTHSVGFGRFGTSPPSLVHIDGDGRGGHLPLGTSTPPIDRHPAGSWPFR